MENIDWNLYTNNTSEFSLNGETILGKCVNVYDGDTVKVVFPVLSKLFKFNCRIVGVDTPEIRTRNKVEKEYGLLVRDKLREKILNKDIQIKTIKDKKGKYGRYLGIIFLDGENINEWLIENGFAEKALY